jgi:uncharacterized protein (DUF1697 family)
VSGKAQPSRFAAFLRGINVGGHRITSSELRLCFQELGFGDVETFRASGNVIFTAQSTSHRELIARIEEGLAASLGYGVPTFLRAAEEVRAIAESQPFAPAQVLAAKGKLQVVMLATRPSSRARQLVLALASDQDRLAFGERELYWLPNGGILDSPLDFKAIGALLGPMTTRTKNTVSQIAGKHFAD